MSPTLLQESLCLSKVNLKINFFHQVLPSSFLYRFLLLSSPLLSFPLLFFFFFLFSSPLLSFPLLSLSFPFLSSLSLSSSPLLSSPQVFVSSYLISSTIQNLSLEVYCHESSFHIQGIFQKTWR